MLPQESQGAMPSPPQAFSPPGPVGFASASGCPAFGVTSRSAACAEAAAPSSLGASSGAETRAADALPVQIVGCAGQGAALAEAGGYEASRCMNIGLPQALMSSLLLIGWRHTKGGEIWSIIGKARLFMSVRKRSKETIHLSDTMGNAS